MDDGRVYVGVEFQIPGDVPRARIEAFDATTGAATNFNPEPYPSSPILTLAIGPSAIYAGGRFSAVGDEHRKSLVAYSVLPPVAAEPENVAGSAVSLVHPNPATSQARITVEVVPAQHVRVEVFTVLGQRVATVFDGPLPPGQAVPLEVDVTGLAAGTYLVRVTGETFTQSRTLTVVR